MRILVTGATGSIGRLVVDRLMESGTAQVRALTTNPAKAALPDGVEVVRGYVGKPETLGTAFDGVDKVYLAPVPGAVAEVVKRACDAGVQPIVDLAGAPYTSWNVVSVAVESSG
ncbi:MAG TPA: NAD(P)H-binding protein, partial [Thermomicrobiales bacterium]|nr:NAD(P)H-binding protein [Thermomicrobiales bacterium]